MASYMNLNGSSSSGTPKSKVPTRSSSPSLHGVQPKSYDRSSRMYYKYDVSSSSLQGLVEYFVSTVLSHCTVVGRPIVYIDYIPCLVNELRGAKSLSFLQPGEREVSVSTVIAASGKDLNDMETRPPQEKFDIITDICSSFTGLSDVPVFFGMQLLLDYLFVNEDRHWGNISFIRDTEGFFRFAPYFDFAESFRSFHLDRVNDSWLHFEPRPYTQDQLERLDALLCGYKLKFDYTAWRSCAPDRLNAIEGVYLDFELQSVTNKFLTALQSFPRKDLLEVV